MLGECGGHGTADDARGVAVHEGHLLGGDVLCGDDEIAFVFAREIVEDDDEFAIFWGLLELGFQLERRGYSLKAWMVSSIESNS